MSTRATSKSETKASPKGAVPKTKASMTSDPENAGGVAMMIPADPDKTLPGRACKICKNLDNDEMVQCDDCDKWHHFSCVGVTNEVETHSWRCPKCEEAKRIRLPTSTSIPYRSTTGMLPIGSEKLPAKQHKPRKINPDDQKKRSTKGSKATALIPAETLDNMQVYSRDQIFRMPVADSGKVVKAQSINSVTSQRSSRTLLKLQLQKLEEERTLEQEEAEKIHTFLEREAEKKHAYLEKKYKLLEEMAKESDSDASSNRIKNWVQDANRLQEDGNLSQCHLERFEPQQHSTHNRSCSNRLASINRHDRASDPNSIGTRSANADSLHNTFNPQGLHNVQPTRGDFIRPQGINPNPLARFDEGNYGNEYEFHDSFPVSRRQLAARQAISRDLPTFSGNHEEWPLFLSTFNTTTAMCGFTSEENMIRLQKCLKGRAYESVKSRLMHPSNVPGVIATLKMLFGQPEAIVHSLIAKINVLPTMREDKLETVVDFAVSVQNFCATVDACGLEEQMYNVSLLHNLVSKLPASIKLDWARYRQTLPAVNLASFGNWIYSLAEAASAVTIPNVAQEFRSTRSDIRYPKKINTFSNPHLESYPEYLPRESSNNTVPPVEKQTPYQACPICKGSCRSADKCKRFLELSRDSRWAVIKEFSLCRRCLRRHKGGCNSKPCGKDGCEFKHHELLHNEQKERRSIAGVTSTPVIDSPLQPVNKQMTYDCNVHRTTSGTVLFRYLPVVLQGPTRSILTYAFLDDGSSLTLLDQAIADDLGLDGTKIPLCLRWTGGTQRYEEDSREVNLGIAGLHHDAKRFQLKGVRTVQELNLPSQSLDINELARKYPHLAGIPINSYEEAQPRILIGLKHAHVNLVLKSQEGGINQPAAVKTRLGWTVCGGWHTDEVPNIVHHTFHACSCNQSDNNLNQALKDYFALDSFGVTKSDTSCKSAADQRAENLLQRLTLLRGARYETGLLWSYDNVRLPDSRAMALHRFLCLEKRLKKDPTLAENLNSQILAYLSKGYIRELTQDELDQTISRSWYLPVFPVTNPNKPNKVRLVWDAAATAFGVSLNSVLLKGPDQLCSLFAILLQFREHRVGLTADIREMFHQILMREEDQQCQRFFWRKNNGELGTFVMRVMTFGACCSPSCAQHIKNLNAERFSEKFSTAVNIIKHKHYVDDMLMSVETEEEAIRLAREVEYIHAQGGFEIRGWICNSQRIVNTLQENATREKNLDLSAEIASEKVLGMWWNTLSDSFTYKIGWDRYDRELLTGQRYPTKREVLKVLMTIFDPLGLISHFLMYLKVLLQEIWREGVQWDDKIPRKLFEKWLVWLQVLPQVENVRIPRCYRVQTSLGSSYSAQLHTFVDASENGFAAAVFLRFEESGTTECTLVAAKTRVAPLKYQSIPRLELQAAVLGSRLCHTVIKSISVPITKRVYWTDSRDVLCWITADHRRYTTFVAARICEIHEISEMHEWRWVPTKLNVADDGTKWDKRPDLSVKSRWFNGPDFLWRSEHEWPQQIRDRRTENELRVNFSAHLSMSEPVFYIQNFSRWKHLLNVVALVYRFRNNCRLQQRKQTKITGPQRSDELQTAETYLLCLAQREAFPEEIAILAKPVSTLAKPTKSIHKSSRLYKLSPWIDDNGIIRMRGRINSCNYAADSAKNPIILPHNHHITLLIIAHYHHLYHHQNHETVINELRQIYHIPRIRVSYSKVRRQCQRCKNESAMPQPPIMAGLPPARLEAFSAPFTHTGIDYFGPMEIVVGRRTEKRWGMLATCLSIRAVHIEVVASLNTSSCIMAIRNFISRRGTPRAIYSDRGTNFIGASRELKEAMSAIDHEGLMKEFVSTETEWLFNTPSAPHMGGSWERLIRSVKKNLLAIRPTRKPSDEILRNLLTEIESIINSRPLTHVPIDEQSAPALTPNHFLLNSSNGSKPLTALEDDGIILKLSWRTSQILANQYWRRWVTDYLPEITRRTKWYTDTKPITIGDVVVIVDPKNPRNCWPKGLVINTCIGKDGRIRSATVRTANGVYERPVAKLAVLDVRSVG